MIPTAFVPLETLPTTATDKIDHRRLRAIGQAVTLEQLAALNPSRGERRPPITKNDKCLQELWAETLGISSRNIGLDDSFLQ